jgi:hypothetical protein
MNLLGPERVRDLVSLVRHAEADDAVRVLVLRAPTPTTSSRTFDLTQVSEYRAEAAKLTGEASIALLSRYLSAGRLITIAQIEGRVRTGIRPGARRRRRPAPHATDGSRASARGDAERRGLQRRAGGTVNAITLAPVADFRRDSDLFGEEVRGSNARR